MSDELELIDGAYQLKSTIAMGNQTQIWEVVEQGTGRHLAMKLVIEGKTETKEAKAAIKAEANIAKLFEHPNIVRFEKFSTSRDATYMLMEFFRAANVKAQIKSELASLHSRCRPLMEGVCQALIYLHEKGWIHRDLKPENVLLNRSGEAKLIDFSLATRFSQGLGKMLGMGGHRRIQGTRTYIAPETILRKAVSPQTDIYSLGVMFFEVLTGKTPFQGFTPQDLLQKHLRMPPPLPSAINENLTPEVDQLLIAMLQKKPKERPASMRDIFMEIRRIKLFKQDALALLAAKEEEEKAHKLSLLAKVDSRTDAERSETLRANPELAEQFEAERAAREEKRRPKRQLASAGAMKDVKAAEARQTQMMPPQPGMPGMMPQPMMPQQMMPMMMPYPMMPQQMPPGMMPGGFPPSGYPQGYPPQGFPQQPGAPQPAPGMPMPAAPSPQPVTPPPAAPPAPSGGRQAPDATHSQRANAPRSVETTASQPAVPPAAAPSPPQAAAPPPAVNPDDLDYMTELPDVI